MAVIEVHDLAKSYGGTRVVDGISFDVERGEIFGIVGPNGAGKTTTVESLAGLRRPDNGSITVLGMNPQQDRIELAQRLGVQLQESALQDRIRVAEVLDLYASFYRQPADWRDLLGRLGLEEKENARYASLSGGQKQRLAVALALVGSPEIAILDELTTGLDPQARRSVWGTIEEIRGSGVTVVLVTHFMEEAERLCDRVMVVAGGEVTALDTPAGLVEGMGSAHHIRFRPSAHIEDEALLALAGIDELHRSGDLIEVVGSGDVVHAVTSLLAQRQVIAHDLRIEQDSLEDAYLAITRETI